MRVAPLLVLVCVPALCLWVAFSHRTEDIEQEPGGGRHEAVASDATVDGATTGVLLRQSVTAAPDSRVDIASSGHRLVLENDLSDRLPHCQLTLWGDSWSRQVHTDKLGCVHVPQGAPRLLNVSVSVPLVLKAPLQFEVVAEGITKVVVRSILDTITGLVLDPQGVPIEDAAVCASEVSVTTSSSGLFSVPRFSESPHDGEALYCSKDGYQSLRALKVAWGTRGVVLTMSRLATVSLSVRRVADGTPVRNFVAQSGRQVGKRFQWASPVRSNGQDHLQMVNIEDGVSVLRVWPGVAADWAPASAEITVHEGSRSYQVCVDAQRSRSFEVVVKDDSGNPVEGAHVAIEEWAGISEPSSAVVSDASRHQWRELISSRSTADGKAIGALGSDACYVRVECNGYASARRCVATYVDKVTITLEKKCEGSVVGVESVLALLQAGGWQGVSIDLVAPATASIRASVWSKGLKAVSVARGEYLMVASGVVREGQSQYRQTVNLGTIRVDRPDWVINVEAMRNDWRFGVIRAHFVCEGLPVAKRVVRLVREAPGDCLITTMAPVVVTDEQGFSVFAIASGDYAISLAGMSQTGSISVPGRGAEVTDLALILK